MLNYCQGSLYFESEFAFKPGTNIYIRISDKKAKREITETLRHIKNKILVMSGKGGVGKSSIAAYLSVALARRGYRVDLMDVDLHGPSIPRILGLNGSIGFGGREGKMIPVKYLPIGSYAKIKIFHTKSRFRT